MKLKDVVFEDFTNYKKASMFLIFPNCSFKCGDFCQNKDLKNEPTKYFDEHKLVESFILNPITTSVVMGGLEPFENFGEMLDFICTLRAVDSESDIVIYTGFNKEEIEDKIKILQTYPNIIIKFGRYIPNRPNKEDSILGLTLASDNQYAEKIS